MAELLVYTSPARGHLYPLIPSLCALQGRGHKVRVRTLGSEVARVRTLGLEVDALSGGVEDREMDDWRAGNPVSAMRRALATFLARAPAEVEELREAIRQKPPDALLVDINSWGAMAAAEASGLPWAAFAPYFLPFEGPGIPPWGLGLTPARGLLGWLRDGALWWVVRRLYDGKLQEHNRLRQQLGLAGLSHAIDWIHLPPRLLYFTAEPFEYPRPWPAHVRLVGPGVWEPPASPPSLSVNDRPLVLVTCSTEYQNDGRLIQTALDGLASEPVQVVATTAALDPSSFSRPANAVVERFLPHGPLLERAACVVCHGAMGISQKALSAGVPLCVVPFGRDQMEVSRHVEVAGAGVRVLAHRLTPARLRDAVRAATGRREGAQALAHAFAALDKDLPVDELERLLEESSRVPSGP